MAGGKVFCIGNGESRKGFDLESLKFDNKTIVYDLKGVLNKENVDKRL